MDKERLEQLESEERKQAQLLEERFQRFKDVPCERTSHALSVTMGNYREATRLAANARREKRREEHERYAAEAVERLNREMKQRTPVTEVDLMYRNACCEKAFRVYCVCSASYECEEHGRHCHGSHD